MNREKRIKITLKSNDYKVLEETIEKIRKVANKAGHSFLAGPIPIRTRTTKVTLNSSPHVYGLSKETYKLKGYKRVIWVSNKAIDSLMSAQVPSTISIKLDAETEEVKKK